MSGFRRALLGALFGALLTLLLHPVSRRVLLGVSTWVPMGRVQRTFRPVKDLLVKPTTLEEASAWVHAACARVIARVPLEKVERRSVIELLEEGNRKDPQNSFWLQTLAFFQESAGESVAAEKSWERAAKCPSYNDYQSAVLADELTKYPRNYVPTWLYAYVYQLRKADALMVAERYARGLLARSDYDSDTGIARRYSTILNFDHARDGARSVPLGLKAADLLELATYPQNFSETVMPKTLHLGRVRVVDRLKSSGRVDQAAEVSKSYSNNEAWRYLISRFDTEGNLAELSLLGAVAGVLPCLLLIGGGIGLLLSGLSLVVDLVSDRERWRPEFVGMVAILAATVVFLGSNAWIGSVATLVSVMFLSASPARQRAVKEDHLGPLFEIVCFGLSMFSLLFFVVYLFGLTAPAQALMEVFPARHELSLFCQIGLGLALLSMVLLTGVVPLWAFVRRHSTPWVFAQGLRIFARTMAWVGISAAVILTPVSLASEKQTRETLDKLLRNEPIYYLLK